MGVEPLTGRRHQIRRHFKHIAHPLVGDATHGKGAHNRAVAQWLGVARLWLHCEWMELPVRDGRLRIEAPVGEEWAKLGFAFGSPPAYDSTFGSPGLDGAFPDL